MLVLCFHSLRRKLGFFREGSCRVRDAGSDLDMRAKFCLEGPCFPRQAVERSKYKTPAFSP